jgi:hypothetical protein
MSSAISPKGEREKNIHEKYRKRKGKIQKSEEERGKKGIRDV